ncbi:MAG: hypothetical protein ACE5IZ_11705, partial [Dehalococcoidia bacterium]
MSQGQPRQHEVYRFRRSMVLKFVVSMLLGRRRDMASDTAASLLAARPQPRVVDDHHVPLQGPF